MRQRVRLLCLLLPAAVVGLLSGCFGVSHNPSYFPYLKFPDDIIRTHAKPGGLGYYANFDPEAVKLEVRPLDVTNPVHTQHVLIATVYDKNGVPRRNRRIEWMLEGVGQIVEVDESGCFPGRGYKVDNRYAVSYTDYFEHRITRGNTDPNDDFQLRPGQSWCVVSAAVEGDTYVTVYAPGVHNWDAGKVIAAAHWVDAEWTFPPSGTARAGSEQVLTTVVVKRTDHQPLANYRVRYRVLDGPPAFFLPSRTQEFVAVTDLSGNANVTLTQAGPQAGVNRIGIEIIRPPDPTKPSAAGIVIGRGEIVRQWQAPQVSLTVAGPPSAGLNQELTYTFTIANTGQVDSQAMTLRSPLPEGLQFLRSMPQAVLDSNALVWALGTLQPGQSHLVQAVYRSSNRQGPVTVCGNVTTVEGLRDEKCITTQITVPLLNVTISAPDTAAVGAPITYQVVVSNPGSGPTTNVALSAAFDPGLEHASRAQPVETQLGTLGPGESRTVPLALTPRQAGRFVNRVTATADGNLQSRAEHTVTVQVGQISLTMSGPNARYVERPVVWTLVVSNPSTVALSNVVVRDQLPREVAFVSATEGGSANGPEVVWNVGVLPPGEQKVLQVTARCQSAAPRAVNRAVATAAGDLQAQAEAALEIRAVPAAFLLEVSDSVDPLPVGGRTTYRIAVTNQGAQPGEKVEIIAVVPPQMRVVNANGPTQPQVLNERVVFPRVEAVAPKQTLAYSVEVEARETGDVRFRVELRSPTIGPEPVVEEESTNIYRPGQPAPAAPAKPPAPAKPTATGSADKAPTPTPRPPAPLPEGPASKPP